MNMYRAWTRALMGFLLAFVVANLVVWKGFTRDLLTFHPYYNGGLDRMGYIVGSKHYRKPESTLPRQHIENIDYKGQHVDVITIGDSFSNAKNNGKDPLYQSWIASLYRLDVLNLQTLEDMDELTTAVTLLNSGYFDKVKPRFVLLESVERLCIMKYAGRINFDSRKPFPEIEAFYRVKKFLKDGGPDIKFINTGNFKFILYNVLYQFSDHAFFSKVYIKDLHTSFFSVKNDRRLLFYHEDIKHIPFATSESVQKMNDNMNTLSSLLKKKGITLFFMPAADKYNMYSEYIINNPYPKSVFFELLRRLPKQYVFVDTKALLSEEINKGEKDVYFADDTHWSWKASKKIAESLLLSQFFPDHLTHSRRSRCAGRQPVFSSIM